MKQEIPVVEVNTPTERLAAEARPSASMLAILIGFLILWLLLDRTATALNSVRGESGIFLAFLIVGAAVTLESVFFKRTPREGLRVLGLGRPTRSGLLAGCLIGLLLLAYFPIFSALTGTPIVLRADWFTFLPGLFGQGGIAEETLFRGFAFRHLREGRTFRQATLLSLLLFTAIHLLLFLTMDAPVAFAATLLAVAVSVPFAALFEYGGNTIWGPAFVHFVIQGAIKVVVIPEASMMPVSLGWMGVCALVPYLVVAFRPVAATSSPQEQATASM